MLNPQSGNNSGNWETRNDMQENLERKIKKKETETGRIWKKKNVKEKQ